MRRNDTTKPKRRYAHSGRYVCAALARCCVLRPRIACLWSTIHHPSWRFFLRLRLCAWVCFTGVQLGAALQEAANKEMDRRELFEACQRLEAELADEKQANAALRDEKGRAAVLSAQRDTAEAAGVRVQEQLTAALERLQTSEERRRVSEESLREVRSQVRVLRACQPARSQRTRSIVSVYVRVRSARARACVVTVSTLRATLHSWNYPRSGKRVAVRWNVSGIELWNSCIRRSRRRKQSASASRSCFSASRCAKNWYMWTGREALMCCKSCVT